MKHLLLTTIAAVVLVGCGPKAPDISIYKAAREGYIEDVKQHLAAGTDVNAKFDDDGSTPLHLSAWRGHFETAELLIAAGSEVNAKMEDGDTPLDLAERKSRRDSPQVKAAKKEIAALLRKHGGKTGEKSKDKGK